LFSFVNLTRMKLEEVQTYLAHLWSTDAVTVYIWTVSSAGTFRSLILRGAHGAQVESVQGSWDIIGPAPSRNCTTNIGVDWKENMLRTALTLNGRISRVIFSRGTPFWR